MVKKTFGELPQEQITADAVIPFEDTGGITKRSNPMEVADLTLHTGVMQGFVLSINADPTRFDITSGIALRIDRTNPLVPVVTEAISPGVTAQLDTELGSTFSHVYLDADTLVVTTELSPVTTLTDLTGRIYLGQFIHAGGNIVNIVPNPIVAYGSSSSQIASLVFHGGTRLIGALITANGTDLSLDSSAGTLQQHGTGFDIDPNQPNEYASPAATPFGVGFFIKVFNEAGGDLNRDLSTNQLDPTMFDEDGLGVLETVPNNRFTVQRCFQTARTDSLLVYYGTEDYVTAQAALDAAEPTFEENFETVQLAAVAKIAIRQDVTDLAAAIVAGTAVIQPLTERV